MAEKRIFDIQTEATIDDITEKVYMWLDKKANEGELQEPSWKFKANVFIKILNNFATKFVPNVATVKGKCYWHDGELYVCDTAYTGDWVPGNFVQTSIGELLMSDTAATEADLVAGSTLPIMTANGPKSLPGNAIAKAGDVAALIPYLVNSVHNLTRTETNGFFAVDNATNGPGKLHTDQVLSFKETDITNCDNILENGIFNVESTFENIPAEMAQNGVLLCISSGSHRKFQIIAEFPVTANLNKRLWVRIYNPTTGWTSWENLTTKQYVDAAVDAAISGIDTKSVYKKTLSANTNFNSVQDGFYYVDTSYTYTNLPITKGFVFSFSSGNYAQQIAIDYFLPNAVFARKKNTSSSWSEWEKTDSEQVFKNRLLASLNGAFDGGHVVCNLFDGNFVTGVSIDTLTSTTFQIIADGNYNSLAVIPVKPSTTYSIIVADGGPESNDYYYFKACTIQSDIGYLKDVIGKANTFKFSKATKTYTKVMEVTTGENDKYLLVQASKTKQPYIEILEGSFSDFVFNDYTNAFKFVSGGAAETKTCSISYVSSNTYNVKFGDYSVALFRTVDNDRSCDNWNIGTVKKGSDTLCPTGTDILGPVRVNSEGDFIGGVHKYEITDFVQVVCDGELVTLDSSLSKDCNNISILLKSRCFTRTNATYCFDRFVSIKIEKNKIHASNTFKCVSSVTLNRATNGGLFAVSNSILINAYLNNYIIEEPPTETISNKSKINVLGVLNTTLGSVYIKNVLGREQDHYSGFFNVFTNESPIRTKIYMDVYNSTGKTLNVGDEVAGEFEYAFS